MDNFLCKTLDQIGCKLKDPKLREKVDNTIITPIVSILLQRTNDMLVKVATMYAILVVLLIVIMWLLWRIHISLPVNPTM